MVEVAAGIGAMILAAARAMGADAVALAQHAGFDVTHASDPDARIPTAYCADRVSPLGGACRGERCGTRTVCEAHGRDSTGSRLFEQGTDDVSAVRQMEHELFGVRIAGGSNAKIHVARSSRLHSSGNGEATDESARRIRLFELGDDALERVRRRLATRPRH
jgi:hypothetical protein